MDQTRFFVYTPPIRVQTGYTLPTEKTELDRNAVFCVWAVSGRSH
jgi:hypothetical protein